MAVSEWRGKLDVCARLKSSQESASVSPAKAESFLLLLCFIGEALTRRALLLIFQSPFSLLSVLLSPSSLRFPLLSRSAPLLRL